MDTLESTGWADGKCRKGRITDRSSITIMLEFHYVTERVLNRQFRHQKCTISKVDELADRHEGNAVLRCARITDTRGGSDLPVRNSKETNLTNKHDELFCGRGHRKYKFWDAERGSQKFRGGDGTCPGTDGDLLGSAVHGDQAIDRVNICLRLLFRAAPPVCRIRMEISLAIPGVDNSLTHSLPCTRKNSYKTRSYQSPHSAGRCPTESSSPRCPPSHPQYPSLGYRYAFRRQPFISNYGLHDGMFRNSAGNYFIDHSRSPMTTVRAWKTMAGQRPERAAEKDRRAWQAWHEHVASCTRQGRTGPTAPHRGKPENLEIFLKGCRQALKYPSAQGQAHHVSALATSKGQPADYTNGEHHRRALRRGSLNTRAPWPSSGGWKSARLYAVTSSFVTRPGLLNLPA